MLREQAEHEAQTLLDNAASEAAHLRAQAHQDGYAQGLEEARRHMQDQLARLCEIVQRAHADTAQILRNVERDVIDLVLLITERVVYRELSLNPSLVVEAVRQAMEVAETGIVVRGRGNPEDLAFVEAAWRDVGAGQGTGLTIEAEGLSTHLGEICHIYTRAGSSRISAEVVGFREGRFVLMPFGDVQGLTPDPVAFFSGRHFTVPVGNELMGRGVDGFARPIDDKGPLGCAQERNLGGLPRSPR